ncbi:MAG: hypothetical protein V4660_18460 [Pseudomonadota bacterium]
MYPQLSEPRSYQANSICDYVLYPSMEVDKVTSLKKRDEPMIRKEDKLSKDETQKPKSKLGAIFLVVAIVIGFIGLFLFWYITGLARGFSNS